VLQEKDSENDDAVEGMVECYQALADNAQYDDLYEDAIGYYEKALALDPDNSNIKREHLDCLYNLGDEKYYQGEYEEAVVFYEKMLEVDPENESALDAKMLCLFNVAYEFYYDEEYESALEYFDKVEQAGVEGWDTTYERIMCWNALGDQLYEWEDYAGALEYYEKSLELDPYDWDAEQMRLECWIGLGYQMKGQGDGAAAKEYFNKVIEYDSDYATVLPYILDEIRILVPEGYFGDEQATAEFEAQWETMVGSNLIINSLPSADYDAQLWTIIAAGENLADYADIILISDELYEQVMEYEGTYLWWYLEDALYDSGIYWNAEYDIFEFDYERGFWSGYNLQTEVNSGYRWCIPENDYDYTYNNAVFDTFIETMLDGMAVQGLWETYRPYCDFICPMNEA